MKLLRIILFLLMALSAPRLGTACSCLPASTQQQFENADIVFRGKLVKHNGNLAIFHVDDYWKGKLGGHVAVEWRRGDRGDCDGFWPRDLKVGADLLVFARLGRDGVYRSRICLPTGPATDSQKIIQELGQGNHEPAKSDAVH